jgi:hypothetical protein
MFQPLIAIIDRLIALVRTREENRRRLFQDLIEPLFQEVQRTFDDYVKYLQEARVMMTAEAPLTDEQVERIRSRRAEQAMVRTKIRKLAAAYGSATRDETVRAYFTSIECLFDPPGQLIGAGNLLHNVWAENEAFLQLLKNAVSTSYPEHVSPGTTASASSELDPMRDEELSQIESKPQYSIFGSPGSGKTYMNLIARLIDASRKLAISTEQPDLYRIAIAKIIASSQVDAEVNWRKLCHLYASLRIKYTTPS